MRNWPGPLTILTAVALALAVLWMLGIRGHLG